VYCSAANESSVAVASGRMSLHDGLDIVAVVGRAAAEVVC